MSASVFPAAPGWYMLAAEQYGEGWRLSRYPIIGWRDYDCSTYFALGQPVLAHEPDGDATFAVLTPGGDVYSSYTDTYDTLEGFVSEMTRRFKKPLAGDSIKLRVVSERALSGEARR